MAFVPTFKLYAQDGETLVYTFPVVQYTNIPQSPKKSTIIEGIRGNGCLIVPGSDASWDIIIRGIFLGDDYEAITTKITGIESSITPHTKYVLEFEKSPTQHFTYYVQRIDPIEYFESLRISGQEYQVILKANSW